MEQKNIILERLRTDKELVAELAGMHMKWLRFVFLAEMGVTVLNAALLLTGTAIYGKKALETLRKKIEK